MPYKQSPSIVTRNIAGETLLVPVTGDMADMRVLYTLNETGLTVWNAVKDCATEEEIAEAVLRDFNVDESTARADIGELLQELLKRKLIQEDAAQ
jgi:uncharacterized lipoprotein YajG